MQKKCVLFDFDGVIADSEPAAFAYMQKAFEKYGVQLDVKACQRFMGTAEMLVLDTIIKEYNLPLTAAEALQKCRNLGNYYEDNPELAPMPGCKEFICALRKRGFLTGLVSSTESNLILAALNRLGMSTFFDVLVCGDMVKHKKPEPECYLKALAHLGVQAEQAIILEDSPTGIRAAKKTGALVVGFKGSVIWQVTSAADVEAADFAACNRMSCFRKEK